MKLVKRSVGAGVSTVFPVSARKRTQSSPWMPTGQVEQSVAAKIVVDDRVLPPLTVGPECQNGRALSKLGTFYRVSTSGGAKS